MMRCLRFAAALLLAWSCRTFCDGALAGPGSEEKPRARAEPLRLERPASAWPALLKLGLAAVAIAGASFGIAWFQRRILSRGARGGFDPGALRVVGRTALSPKHFVWVLEFRGREIVVGGSPDRLTLLAAFEREPSRPAESRDEEPAPDRARQGSGEGGGRARRVTARDLLPYRRQVERLRGILRSAEGVPSGEREAT